MTFPAVDKIAPDFTLLNQFGDKVTLKSFKGKKNVVLYFYPRASTPGCTVQACGIRDNQLVFDKNDTVVLAVSTDSVKKLKGFDDKQSLGFTLLSDEDHLVAELYGVWALKKFMGRESMGVLRTTFIIGKDGKLKHIVPKVNTKTHHQDVLTLLDSIA
jgi:peroxiredoxin Q/BCP